LFSRAVPSTDSADQEVTLAGRRTHAVVPRTAALRTDASKRSRSVGRRCGGVQCLLLCSAQPGRALVTGRRACVHSPHRCAPARVIMAVHSRCSISSLCDHPPGSVTHHVIRTFLSFDATALPRQIATLLPRSAASISPRTLPMSFSKFSLGYDGGRRSGGPEPACQCFPFFRSKRGR